MAYSRSLSKQRSRKRKRSRSRRLLAFGAIAILMAAAAGVWAWAANGKSAPGGNDGKSAQVQATSSPSELSVSTPATGQPATDALSEGGDSTDSPPASESASPSDASSDPDAAAPDDNTTPDDGKVTFAFVGDILPAASVAELMAKNGYDYPYRYAKQLLQAADLAVGNLESSITDRGTPEQNKQYLFRGPKEALPALKEAGFDVLNLANNHTLDFGWEGLRDTMDALSDEKLPYLGAGADDAEAYTPYYAESGGLTVGFVGVTKVLPETDWKAGPNHPGLAEAYDPTKAVAAIKDAKANADLVVVMVHWGVERAERPRSSDMELGHSFIDAGADLVIGSHPHVLQGFESYKGKWIAYSLGNFVFSTTGNVKTSQTGVLQAECEKTGSCKLQLHPMFAKDSQPAPMEEEAARILLRQLSNVSYGAIVKENGDIEAR